LRTALTGLLPQHALSALARRLAASQRPALKQAMIDAVVRRFGVDLTEAAEPDPRAYPSFNAFFTRALRPDARVPEPDRRAVLMPADGHISQCGRISAGRLLQAKGQQFSAAELLADDARAAAFDGGLFATVYLAPRDYHRVHMPADGQLVDTVHVPGRLFSVGTASVAAVPRLFARNERLVCHFDCDFGPMAVVLVGAMLVSGIETVFGGVTVPPYARRVSPRDWRGSGIHLARFAELGRFNYGSTVIVLLPPGVATLEPRLAAEVPVRVGQALAWRG
jgi:phosphatidylserine decarboxylase